jgi:hypothetical protein
MFARGQRKGGPVSFHQLQQWAGVGKLLPSDHVLQPGSQKWQRAEDVPGLFGSPGKQEPPAPLPPPAALAPTPTANNRLLVLVLVGAGGMLFLLLGVVLVVVCVMGDFGRPAETGGAEAPTPEREARPRTNKSAKPKAATPTLTPRQKEINTAVERGAGFLRKRLAEGGKLYAVGDPQSGAHTGALALAALTLLECGADPGDRDVQAAATEVRQRATDLRFTYSIALAILFLDRLNAHREKNPDPTDKALIRTLALRLMGSQNPKSGWEYFCRVLPATDEEKLVKRLESGQYRPGDSWVNNNARPTIYYDNSIGQFVTLALWASRKYQVPMRAPLLAVEQRYRSNQRPDGSWSYNDVNPFARDTSTCAALISLAVARGVQDEGQGGGADLLQDPVVERALKHLQGVVGTRNTVSPEQLARGQQRTRELEETLRQAENTRDPAEILRLAEKLKVLDNASELRGLLFDGDNWGDLYFLWSLERMAVIYDLKKVGDVDWHEWGTDIILKAQAPDGSWRERFPGLPDTCFALLFLKRANIVKDLTDKLRGTLAQAGIQQPPAAPPRKRE